MPSMSGDTGQVPVHFRHPSLLLLLPFVLDNLFSAYTAEVEEHNRSAGPTERLKDTSSELVEVTVANTFIAWYKLYSSISPGYAIRKSFQELFWKCKSI